MDEQHKAGASPPRFPVLFPNWQSPPLLNQARDVESVWELGPPMSDVVRDSTESEAFKSSIFAV